MVATLTANMDALAQCIADLERNVTTLNMYSLPRINSEVYAAAGGNHSNGMRERVQGILSHLYALCASAEGAIESHALLMDELDEDTLRGSDTATADGAGPHAPVGSTPASP